MPWAARNEQFKITCYGATKEEAEERVRKAVALVLERLMKYAPSEFCRRLEQLGLLTFTTTERRSKQE